MSKNHKVLIKRARRKRYIKRKKKELAEKLQLMRINRPQPVVKAVEPPSTPEDNPDHKSE